MIIKLLNYFSIFIPVLFLFACNDQPNEKDAVLDLKVDKALYEISPSASFILMAMHLQKDLNCLLSESFENHSNTTVEEMKKFDTTSNLIERTSNNFKVRCNFYNEAIEETSSVFNKIKSNKRLPNELYVFSVFVKADDENDFLYKEEEIGLFNSFASCAKLETFARENNNPTLKCRKWSE